MIWNFIVNEVWPLLAPLLATFLVGVISAVGVSIRNQVHNRFIADGYDMAAKAAAGWINAHLQINPLPVSEDLTAKTPQGVPAHPLLIEAVEYMKNSFPDAIGKVEKATNSKLGSGELAADILGALGKLFPGPLGIGAKIIGAAIKK